MNAFTAIVHGHVQGVGFRFYVRNNAVLLGITGTVRNLSDGTVEIVANGAVEDLEQLLHYLDIGPVGSQVEKVDIQWFRTESVLKTFEIRG